MCRSRRRRCPRSPTSPTWTCWGWSCPVLNAPHSGCPLAAQPPGWLARSSRSDQPIVGVRPAQCPRLRLGHRQHDGGGDHRLVLGRQDVGPVVRRAVLAQQVQPRGSRRRPCVRAPGPTPGPSRPRSGGTSAMPDAIGADGDSVAAVVHHAIGGVVALRDLGHQVGLLDRGGDDDGRAPRSRDVGHGRHAGSTSRSCRRPPTPRPPRPPMPYRCWPWVPPSGRRIVTGARVVQPSLPRIENGFWRRKSLHGP